VPGGKSFFENFTSFIKPLKRTVTGGRSEQEIIHAVIERIHVKDEDPEIPGANEEDLYSRLLRRIRMKVDEAQITTDDLLRSYDHPLEAILLFKFIERIKGKESTALKERLPQVGFKFLRNGLWILPPTRTPHNITNSDELKLWVYQNLIKPTRRDLQYVLPIVSVIDLKKTIGERRRVIKRPLSVTVFSMMDIEEIFPAKHIHNQLKKKGYSVEEIIRGGDIILLTSVFADESTMATILASKAELVQKMQAIMGTNALSLPYIAALNEVDLTTAFTGILPHPKDFAQRLVVEARYWQRFLDGEETAEEAQQPQPPPAEEKTAG
jgi:hypothetical protein